MITEASVVQQNTAATQNAPTPDVSANVVEDNKVQAEDYKEWLEQASEICGIEMKGDIDPTHKQAENIVPAADNLASQLGLEDISGIQADIDDEDAAELDKMDEESRQYAFTAEDVGLCNSEGSYSPALEGAWNNVLLFSENVERLGVHHKEVDEAILGLESAGVIDYETAVKLRDRIPGSMDKVNVKMFTKLPSSVGYKMAREGSLAGKVLIGTLIIAGSIFLIYKILTWTIDGIKAIIKIIKRNRERRRNYRKTYDKTSGETFDAEAVDIDKMAKALYTDPTSEVKAKMKAAGRQPTQLRDIKWCDTKDFANLITPVLQMHIDDIDGSKVRIFNDRLERLVTQVHESVVFTNEILNGVNEIPGEELNALIINQGLNEQLKFANEFINEFNIRITFSNNSNIERLKAVYEWLDERIKPIFGITLSKAPPMEMVYQLTDVHFADLNDEFAARIASIRETLNPKGKGTTVVSDTAEQSEVRKEIIKDITVTFMALSNVIRSIYHYTLYLESLIGAEDAFINKVRRFTA
jgi:hypothetical protein